MSDSGHSFKAVTVEALAAPKRWSLNGGPFGSKLVSSMYVDAGVPVIRGCNLPMDRRFDESDFVFVSPEKADELRQHLAGPGDLILTQRGTLGQVGLIPKSASYEKYVVSQSQMKLMVNPDLADASFLYYYFRMPRTARRIEDLALRSGVPHINLAILRSFVVDLPPLAQQRHMAAILGTYDDLIEVNRRRIAVLEEMTRRLFEEWFVHHRFPEHAGSQPLPIGTADALIDFDPATQLPRAGRKPFIPMTLLSTGSSLIDSHEWREAGSGAKFKNGDTLFARITPCLENGKTGLVRGLPGDGVGFGSTEFIVMRGRLAGPAFTYLLARHDAFRRHAQKSMSGATGRQRARTESLRTFSFVNPSKQILDRFDSLAWPMLELVGRLGEANKRLAASRDMLLPRLISGDVPIATAERELETVA